MHAFRRLTPATLTFLALVLVALCGSGTIAAAESSGPAAKKPIVAAACTECPWGTIAEVLRQALQPHGYDLQICYTCSRGNNPRIVAGDLKPPPTDPEGSPPPPVGPIDFGITSGANLWAAYQGKLDYSRDGPRRNLRLVARVELPQYAVLAVKASSGITDLREIKAKRIPARIITAVNATTEPILKYYGIMPKELQSWGGSIIPYVGTLPRDPDAFDVFIAIAAYLGGAPEVRPLYLASARHDLRFLPMPQDLRATLASELGMELVSIPHGEFRGVDEPVPTVGRSNQVVYGRDDLAGEFAYTLAKALDERRDLLRWVHMPLSYDPRTVAELAPVPLHPGAERYYREAGYLK